MEFKLKEVKKTEALTLDFLTESFYRLMLSTDSFAKEACKAVLILHPVQYEELQNSMILYPIEGIFEGTDNELKNIKLYGFPITIYKSEDITKGKFELLIK